MKTKSNAIVMIAIVIISIAIYSFPAKAEKIPCPEFFECCESNSVWETKNCAHGYFCADNICRYESARKGLCESCSSDKECDAGLWCRQGLCKTTDYDISCFPCVPNGEWYQCKGPNQVTYKCNSNGYGWTRAEILCPTGCDTSTGKCYVSIITPPEETNLWVFILFLIVIVGLGGFLYKKYYK